MVIVFHRTACASWAVYKIFRKQVLAKRAAFSSKSGVINLTNSFACEIVRRWWVNIAVYPGFKYVETRRVCSGSSFHSRTANGKKEL